MTDIDAMRGRFDRLSDDELISIIQDWDADEWRPEVFDIVCSILESRGLSSRNILSESTEAMGPDSDSSTPPDHRSLVTIAEYLTEIEADADRMALEQAGLKAWVRVDHGEYGGMGVGAKLQVLPGDLAAAREVLEAPHATDSALPPEYSDLKCPRCGSSDVTESEELLDVLNPSSATRTVAERRGWFYRCASCAHTWSE